MSRAVVLLALALAVPLGHSPAGLSVHPSGWSSDPHFTVSWDPPSFTPTAVCIKYFEPPDGPNDFDLRLGYSGNSVEVVAPAEGRIPTFLWFEEGNSSYWDEAGEVYLLYDASPPRLKASAVTQGPYVTSTLVHLEVDAGDSLSGLSSMRISVDGGEPMDMGYQDEVTVEIGPWEGQHRIIIEVFDAAGNSASQTVDVVADFTPPEVRASVHGAKPVEGSWVTSNGSVEISVKADDNVSGVSAIFASWDPMMDNAWELEGEEVINLPNSGYNIVYVVSVNGAGLPTQPIPITIYRDIQPPSFAVLNYTKVLLGPGNVTLSISAYDDFGVAWICVGEKLFEYSDTVIFEVDSAGILHLPVFVVDYVGHRSATEILEVYAYRGRPVLEASYQNVTMNAFIHVSLEVQGELARPLAVHLGNGEEIPFSPNITIRLDPVPGRHEVSMWVEDELGVESTTLVLEVYLDLAPPSSKLIPNGSSVLVEAEDDSWVNEVIVFERDESGWSPIANLSSGEKLDLAPGLHVLMSIAVDAAGRVEPWDPSKAIKVIVDSEPPTSSLKSTLLDNGTILIEVNATDDVGIKRVMVQVLEGGAWRNITGNGTKIYFKPRGKGTYKFRSIAVDLAGNFEVKEGYDDYVKVGGSRLKLYLPLVLIPLLLYGLGPRLGAIARLIRR